MKTNTEVKDMPKRRNQPATKATIESRPCLVCQGTHTGPSNSCMACERRLTNMGDDNAPQHDRDVMEIIREPRKERRSRMVQNLGRLANKSLQGFKRKYEMLRRQFKVCVKRALRKSELLRTQSRINLAKNAIRKKSNFGINVESICN